jgi:chaperonin GroEL
LGTIQNSSSRNENLATVRPAFGRSLSRRIIMFGFQGGESADTVARKQGVHAGCPAAMEQGAASVAGLLITTDAMVAELPNKNGSAAGTASGGGMGF